eukprot:gene9882-12124_t
MNWTPYFNWSKKNSLRLQKLWNTFFLINETLDEFTVHLISPVWKEINSLIIPTQDNTQLHFDWIDILFKRALNHMNPAVIKILIIDVLNATQYIPYLPLGFISSTLIGSVSNPGLFKGPTENIIHPAIQSFLQTYFQSRSNIQAKSEFIKCLLVAITQKHLFKDLFIDIMKFISDTCGSTEQKDLLPVISDEFMPSISTILDISNSTNHSTKIFNENNSKLFLNIGIEALEGSNFYCSLPILHCLKILLPECALESSKLEFNQELFEKVLSYGWNCSIDSGTLNNIGEFIQLAFNPKILSLLPPENSYNHHNCLKQYFKSIIKISETILGVSNLLILKCAPIFKCYPNIATLYIDEIYESITFGDLKNDGMDLSTDDKDELSFYEPQVGIPSFVFNLHQDSTCLSEEEEEKFGIGNVPYKDSFGRAVCSVFLKSVAEFSINHPKSFEYKSFINSMARKLLYENFNDDFIKRKDYLLNTQVHRIKIRIWQTLSLIAEYIVPVDQDEKFEIGDLIVKIFQLFNLPSVRRLINIFIVNFTKRYPEIIEYSLLKLIDDVNLRGDILTSVAYTAGYVLFNITDDMKLFKKVFNRVLSLSCSGHQILKGIVCTVVSKLIDNGKLNGKLDQGFLDYLEQLNYFLKKNVQASKSLEKQKNLYDLDQIECSFNNLFFEIPIQEQLAHSEIIPPSIFEFLVNNIIENSPITKQLRDYLTKKYKENYSSMLLKIQSINENTEQEESNNQQVVDGDEFIENSYQKKILPWAEVEFDTREKLKTKSRQQIIIVATFVDLVPNLAGLARTSEIFNVECLVVRDLKVINDTAFQKISVSAEKWLPMEEVSLENLEQYLISKKEEGYSLLGVEQTSSSSQLNQFSFPEKSVLLLGQEKQGIPTEYINLLDRCIEIPQLGITRSLNVHVSGSILMWEYTKQSLNGRSSTK